MNTLDIQDTLPDGSTHPTRTITRANIQSVATLLEGGESLDVVLSMLRTSASNAAIAHISQHNKMIGHHRKDFRARTRAILASRRT